MPYVDLELHPGQNSGQPLYQGNFERKKSKKLNINFIFFLSKDLQTKPIALDYSNHVSQGQSDVGYQELACAPHSEQNQYQSMQSSAFLTMAPPQPPPRAGYQTMQDNPEYQTMSTMSTSPFKRSYTSQSGLSAPPTKLPPLPGNKATPPTPPRRQYQSTDLRSNDAGPVDSYQSMVFSLFFFIKSDFFSSLFMVDLPNNAGQTGPITGAYNAQPQDPQGYTDLPLNP